MDQEPQGWQPELEELRERQRITQQMGGPERIKPLTDPDSFLELGSIAGKATYDSDSKVMTDFMPANGVFDRAPLRTPGQSFFTMRP